MSRRGGHECTPQPQKHNPARMCAVGALLGTIAIIEPAAHLAAPLSLGLSAAFWTSLPEALAARPAAPLEHSRAGVTACNGQ